MEKHLCVVGAGKVLQRGPHLSNTLSYLRYTSLVTYNANHTLLYSLIGDFFMIWRLVKDFKSNTVFSACFNYDIAIYYI